jgi:hypothetical protein
VAARPGATQNASDASERRGAAASLAALTLGYMLVAQGLVEKDAARDVLEDSVNAQRQEWKRGGSPERDAAAELLERIMDSRDLGSLTDSRSACRVQRRLDLGLQGLQGLRRSGRRAAHATTGRLSAPVPGG